MLYIIHRDDRIVVTLNALHAAYAILRGERVDFLSHIVIEEDEC